MSNLTHAQIRALYANAEKLSVHHQIGLMRLLAMALRDDPYGNPEVKDFALTVMSCADEMERELAKEAKPDPRDRRDPITVDYTHHGLGRAA